MENTNFVTWISTLTGGKERWSSHEFPLHQQFNTAILRCILLKYIYHVFIYYNKGSILSCLAVSKCLFYESGKILWRCYCYLS